MNRFEDVFNVENFRKHSEFMRIEHMVHLGENGLPNTVKITGSGGVYGAMVGIWSLGAVRPQNSKHALRRMAYFSSCGALLGGTFAASTSIVAAYRGKDTPINYFFGGMTTGAVIGTISKSLPIGFGMAAVLGSTAAFAKLWVIEGWPHPIGKPEY
ncbi:NADH dehydrogenase [ubiquinone] 1 alpha subcomplex subunit 11-like [Antedon mediterranea]|uniref:NADH dehydrogenase [ubiquinone] 1 alpha subcomplex subunit 11-like n=1 Tax=Antedon mediterranea TaxID=105859 RepID=UPI003AF73CE7